MIIAVDFDGTCTTHEYPRIGREIGAAPVLKRLVEAGHQLILWTMRSGQELEQAVQWFAERGIPLFGVNGDPTQQIWTASAKPYAQLYIDDAALGCPLCQPRFSGERPYVDWEKVERLLFPEQEMAGRAIGEKAAESSGSQPTATLRAESLAVKILACLGIMS